MANDTAFVEHCRELLAALGPVRVRRMFGGHGLYVDERFVALVIDNRLYLKADEHCRGAFETAGSQPFSYERADGQRTVLGYWLAPDEAMDAPALMQPWARLALGAALRAAAVKPPPRTPKAHAARSTHQTPSKRRRRPVG